MYVAMETTFIIIMLRASYSHTLHPSLNSHPHSTPHLTQHTPSRFQGAPIWSSGKSSITWPLCWNGRWGRGCVWTTLKLYSTIFSLSPTTSCRWTHRPGRVRRGMRERKMEGGGGKGERGNVVVEGNWNEGGEKGRRNIELLLTICIRVLVWLV